MTVVQASVHPAQVGIGDTFQYVVVAKGLSGAQARVVADPGPFELARPSSVHRDGDTVRVVQTLVCVDRSCAPGDTARRVTLPAPRAGSTVGAAQAVTVVPRVPAQAVAAPRAVYREQTQVPGSAAPFVAVAVVLVIAAVLLALTGAALLAVRRRPEADARGPLGLADALRLLRESAARPVPDRRRASDLVARLAGSAEATELAWAPPPPEPSDVERLAERVGGTT